MGEYEIQDALSTLRRLEKEIADAYWIDGGRIKDSDLERWAGELHAARSILQTVYDSDRMESDTAEPWLGTGAS